MRTILIGLVRLYRWFLSPLLGSNCRFHPSCSCYAQESLQRHAWHPGGYDPVPASLPPIFKRPSHE